MEFLEYLKKGWEVVRLDQGAIGELSSDRNAIGPAITFLAIGGVCGAIGIGYLPGIVLFPIARVIAYFLFIGLIHFLASTLYDARGDFTELFIPPAIASFLTWITIFGFMSYALAVLAGLWLMVVTVLTAERVYGLPRRNAALAVGGSALVFLVLWAIFRNSAQAVGAGMGV